MKRQVLRSRVARRILLLFITCSLLPIVALSVVSSRFVTDQLNLQSRQRLHRSAKSTGMEILGRISVAESELQLVATILAAGNEIPTGSRWESLVKNLSARFRGFAVFEGTQRVAGEIDEPPRIDEAARSHLEAGQVHLAVTARNGHPRFLLVTTFNRRFDLVGEIKADFLWGVQDDVGLPNNTELLVLDSEQNVLFRSPGAPASLEHAMGQATSTEFTWSDGEQEYIGRSWSLFLTGHYAAPSWTVVQNMSRADVLAPLAQFTKLLPLVATLCLAVVTLLSVVQIRRSLVPLEILQQGTQRISRGEFDTRVSIDSHDEFQQLAESFNSMASRLGRQFRTLSTVAELDRTILSAVKVDEIARAVVSRIPERFPCDCVAVTIMRRRDKSSARLYLQRADDPMKVSIETVLVTPDEQDRLADIGGELLFLPQREFPAHLDLLANSGCEHCLILPVLIRNAVAGCIVLGYRTLPEFENEDLSEARELADRVAVALSNARLIEELEEVNWETLHALARAVDANSPWTSGHSERVTALALKLGRQLELPEKELVILHRGGLLHDVGKIGVPSQILDKPGKLTAEEMRLMQSHVVIGARILEPISAYSDEIPIVLYHHEQYSGHGYPEGLAGESIPYLARILAVADVFDALISDRPYREPWSLDRVVRYIEEQSGALFDPRVVEAFRHVLGDAKRRETEEGVGACALLQST